MVGLANSYEESALSDARDWNHRRPRVLRLQTQKGDGMNAYYGGNYGVAVTEWSASNMRTWPQQVERFPDWETAGQREAEGRPRITTASEFRQMVSDSNRYVSLTNPTFHSMEYAQAALGISGSIPNQLQQLFNLYRNGIASKNVSPAPYAAGFVKAMSENNVDAAAVQTSGGNPGQTSARQQTQREDARFLAQDYGQTTTFKQWWRRNKKWAQPALYGVGALALIGFFLRQKNTSQTSSGPLPASRRSRAR